MELMVAMAITTIIVGVLVNITGSAVDTWSRSRAELRAARQAKAMVDVMANDFESLVTRSGGTAEWLSAISEIPSGGSKNAALLVFFTAATDRYDGQVGSAADAGGDISCVGYQLQYKDPLQSGGSSLETFVLNRHLVDPDDTFNQLLGKTNETTRLNNLFTTTFGTNLEEQRSFVCENIFQFTVVFHVEAYVETAPGSGIMQIENRLVKIQPDEGKSVFRITGSGLVMEPVEVLDAEIANGRVTAVEVSMSVLSDSGMNALRKSTGLADNSEWIQKNTFHYSRLIQLPSM